MSTLVHYFHRPNLPLFDNVLYTEYFEKFCLYSLHSTDSLADDEYAEEPFQGESRQKARQRRRDTGAIARIHQQTPMWLQDST